jgi:hypothetical protein
MRPMRLRDGSIGRRIGLPGRFRGNVALRPRSRRSVHDEPLLDYWINPQKVAVTADVELTVIEQVGLVVVQEPVYPTKDVA